MTYIYRIQHITASPAHVARAEPSTAARPGHHLAGHCPRRAGERENPQVELVRHAVDVTVARCQIASSVLDVP